MLVNTEKKQISLNQFISKKKETYQIETDVIVNDSKPDVLNIVSTRGILNIYKQEKLEGKIKIEGAINTYILYLADSEKTEYRSINTNLDFTKVIEIDNSNYDLDIIIDHLVKKIDTKIINGRKLNIKAEVETQIEMYSNEKVDIVTDTQEIENIQLLNRNESFNTLVGKGSSKVYAKDTINIDSLDNLSEIMNVDFKIIDTEEKLSYNKVLSKSNASIEIMYMTEDAKIKLVTSQIPIMGFVDIPNVNDKCKCYIKNNLINLIVKSNNVEEHSIYVEAEIEIECRVYENKDINIVEDLYSTTQNITYQNKKINAITETNKIVETYTLKENLRIPELMGQILELEAKPITNNVETKNGVIKIDGELELNVLFEHNYELIIRTIDLPFSQEINSDKVNEKSIISSKLILKKKEYIINNGNVEVTIVLDFEILEQKKKEINLIYDIQENEERIDNIYSMIIYFVKPGDTLWKIAKKFQSTVDEITQINNISNSDNINIGQQLYIPKTCCRAKTI